MAVEELCTLDVAVGAPSIDRGGGTNRRLDEATTR